MFEHQIVWEKKNFAPTDRIRITVGLKGERIVVGRNLPNTGVAIVEPDISQVGIFYIDREKGGKDELHPND